MLDPRLRHVFRRGYDGLGRSDDEVQPQQLFRFFGLLCSTTYVACHLDDIFSFAICCFANRTDTRRQPFEVTRDHRCVFLKLKMFVFTPSTFSDCAGM